MRKIEKREEPAELREWRAAHQADPAGGGINYGYDTLRQSPDVVGPLLESLLAEQGGLCAYTGRKIDSGSAHVEHLLPQAYCERGQDVAYDNMMACWPQPNGPSGQYGAHAKGSWPSRAEVAMFVSPLSNGCEARFVFNQRGEITPANPADHAAARTIEKLKLDHKLLTALRGREIESVLGTMRSLSLKEARKRLRSIRDAEAALNGGANVQLDPYCFALKQALARFIKAGERIQKFAKAN
ncbi:MAG: TIGR02646 family protein [Verrucomicrobia bacterium]|nr:TIGR02646 family protein [Verrucomicrobiota bacterium]